MKKFLYGLLAIVCLFALSGCGNSETKTYVVDDLTIVLPDTFVQEDMSGFLSYLENDEAGITVAEETFTDLEAIGLNSESTLDDYAAAVMASNDAEYELNNADNYIYFYYDSTVNGTDYHYMSALLKGDDEFYLISFFCFAEDSEKYDSIFKNWADTIVVNTDVHE